MNMFWRLETFEWPRLIQEFVYKLVYVLIVYTNAVDTRAVMSEKYYLGFSEVSAVPSFCYGWSEEAMLAENIKAILLTREFPVHYRK